MAPLTHPLVDLVLRVLGAPADLLTRLSDDADEIWEPFLVDGPLAPIVGGS